MILPRSFYQRDTVTVARELAGAVLVRRTPEGVTRGRIVETEAYLGTRDPAAHSYRGRTKRVEIQYGEKGHAYVYLIYGMHWCVNLTAGPPGIPEAVLIRALEPLEGQTLMTERRGPGRELCRGPGRLCRAMEITGAQNGADLCGQSDGLWLEEGETAQVEATARIGVAYAGEAALWPLRFVVKNSPWTSGS